ncbi:dentin sialophosphoprotein-like [Teleopsis dalmanni]|uniref:dentin sialophosphoprotein-like n=1 Tax=Teleopsis dalmanni TaxID=139649 RepID=UPI000D32A63B|nr:dentin sialophosphoprotein-like [Teleopsis dalmanni]XP_037958066.1 dentin sialophosphoprotein-like [Teleopsis dalmanni]
MDTGDDEQDSVDKNLVGSAKKSKLTQENETLPSGVVSTHEGQKPSSSSRAASHEQGKTYPNVYTREFGDNAASSSNNAYGVSNREALNIADIAKKFSSPDSVVEQNPELKITQSDSKVQIIEKITKIIESNIKEQMKKAESAKMLIGEKREFKVSNTEVGENKYLKIDNTTKQIKKNEDIDTDNSNLLVEDKNALKTNSMEVLEKKVINKDKQASKYIRQDPKNGNAAENIDATIENIFLDDTNESFSIASITEDDIEKVHTHESDSSEGTNSANDTGGTDYTADNKNVSQIVKSCNVNKTDESDEFNDTDDLDNTYSIDGTDHSDESEDTDVSDDSDDTDDADSSDDTGGTNDTKNTDDTDSTDGTDENNDTNKVENNDIANTNQPEKSEKYKDKHAAEKQETLELNKIEAADIVDELEVGSFAVYKNDNKKSENSESSIDIMAEILRTEIDEKFISSPIVNCEPETTAEGLKNNNFKMDSTLNHTEIKNEPQDDKNVKRQITWWDEIQEGDCGPDPLVSQIQCDGNVLMRIVKHCTEAGETDLAQGALLGLLDGKCLEINHCFSYPRASEEHFDDDAYQFHLMRRLRHVNIDHFHVGWYQNSNLGNFLSKGLLESQFNYQTNIEESVVLIYDTVKSSRGFLSLNAYRLSPQAIELYKSGDFTAPTMRRLNVTFENLYHEIPIVYKNSALSNVLLNELVDVVPHLSNIYPILEMGTDSILVKYMSTFNFCVDHLFLDGIRQCKFLIQTSKSNLEKQRALSKLAADNAFRASRGLPPKSAEDVLKNIPPVQVPSNIGSVVAASIINMNSQSMAQFCAQSMAKLELTVPLQIAKEKMHLKKKLRKEVEETKIKLKKEKKIRKKKKSSRV